MVELIDLSRWKTKTIILLELADKGVTINERTWRLYVEEHNKKFMNHEVDTYIIHSKNGYKLSRDKDEITASIRDLKKRGLNMLWKFSRTRKALGEQDNLRFELEELGVL
jgi:hypothetical protein